MERSFTEARQMLIFRGIAEVLNRSFTLREALDGALHRIVELLDVQAGWIFLYDQETREFRLAADVNLPGALAAAGKRRMTGDCRCNQLLREGRLTEAVNLIPCARLEQALPETPELHRHASVPLIAQDETVGILNLLLPHGRAFNADELAMLESIGHELAVTIQRARLFDAVRNQEHVRRELMQRLLVAQEEERRRIAQDFHDHSGQIVTALIIQLDQLAADVGSKNKQLAADLRRVRGLADQFLDDLRKLIYDLRPPVLDDLGLVPAVRWYVDSYVRPAGLDVELQVDDLGGRLPQDLETVAFRIFQEAVTNVLRHARASRIEIRVSRKGEWLIVMVRDNGVGFDPDGGPESQDRRTLGLHGMRERAQLVDGSVQILSANGVGTTILARLPLPVLDSATPAQ
ncbi:MAG: sensor histidine kinase [Armatimonadetes bacterium]|nr:sensor histidine kinase [Armatimonadota bacterium]